MRNKLLFIFLAIVALGLTGCGKEEESTITTIDVDQQQESAVAPAVNSVDSSSQTLLNQNNQVTNEKNTQVNPPALPPASVLATPGNAPAAAIESSQNQSQQSNPIQVSGQQNVSDASVIQTQSPAPSQAQAAAAQSPVVVSDVAAASNSTTTNPDVQMISPEEAYPDDLSMDVNIGQNAMPKIPEQLPQLPPLPPPLPQPQQLGQ
ncbi:MAG: hypothetical protein A2V89_03305 [Gammaproteobacteria bacterium RBG_16_37_9]|nr:MAG: hypothetical protein A2V89_03305 [Gammaproteobacteria bacterium RBG_16_37_9]